MNYCVWRCVPDVSMEREVLHVHLLLHHLVILKQFLSMVFNCISSVRGRREEMGRNRKKTLIFFVGNFIVVRMKQLWNYLRYIVELRKLNKCFQCFHVVKNQDSHYGRREIQTEDEAGQGKLFGDELDSKVSVRIVISGIFIGRWLDYIIIHKYYIDHVCIVDYICIYVHV